jgi:hypothetical protein
MKQDVGGDSVQRPGIGRQMLVSPEPEEAPVSLFNRS